MTSSPQQPREPAQQPPRLFVAFQFRLHGNTQGDRRCDTRRLDRQVMSQGVERGLDGVEPGMRAVGFVRHGRRSVVRCEVIFDDDDRNDTHVLRGEFAPACVTQITDGVIHV